jgi:hypothetical protein
MHARSTGAILDERVVLKGYAYGRVPTILVVVA